MELYVGGYKNGKLNYVLNKYKDNKPMIINDFHLWFRELLEKEENARERVLEFVEEHPDCVIICDEIGNGIVPMEKFDRNYREALGRMLTELAQRADHVERIVCGLGQVLK